jgi:hypothetical protein
MYTFGVLVIFAFIISATIFGKKIKERQFETGCIVFATAFIGCILVNGIVGLKVPYTVELVKHRNLKLRETTIITDTTIKFNSYLRYKYEISKKDTNQYLDFNNYAGYLHPYDTKIVFIDANDTITKPYYEKFKEVRIADDKWISSMGLPRGKATFVFHIPNDSINRVFMNYLNKNFFKNENVKTAQLN